MNCISANQSERLCAIRALSLRLACIGALCLSGCQAWQPAAYAPPPVPFAPVAAQMNPLYVPALDRDFVWDQVVDVVDDYFRIDREDRVKLAGDTLTEGLLQTYPRGGSTLLEPWNGDSANFYERLESTLQSIRRTAQVHVIPSDNGGYLIDVVVVKELENVSRPETGAISQVNSQALRNDDSLTRVTNPVRGLPVTLDWINKGRDTALEQAILAQIQARLGGYPAPPTTY